MKLATTICVLCFLGIVGQIGLVVGQHRNSTGCSPGETVELSRCCATTGDRLKFANPGLELQLHPGWSVAALPVACEKPAYADVGEAGASPSYGPMRFDSAASATIPHLIAAAARKHHVSESRALALAWSESRYTDAVRHERNGSFSVGPLQINSRSFPGAETWPVERRVDEGVKYLARLIQKYADDAEQVYRWGHRRPW